MIYKTSKILEKNNYINSWNTFSRVLFLINSFSRYIHICDDLESWKEIAEVYSFFWKTAILVDNKEKLSCLLWWFWDIFILPKNVFLSEISLYLLKNKESFLIKKDESYDFEDFIKKLTSFWYSHKSYVEAWNYNRLWDILTIKPSFWDKKYKVSFFWNIVDEIVEIDDFSQESRAISEVCFWSFEEIWKDDEAIFDKEPDFKMIDEINNLSFLKILDSLDLSFFWDKKYFDNFVNLNLFPWIESYIDLWISDLNFSSIEDFNDFLSNFKWKKFIYTKSKKVVLDYLEINNIKNVEVFSKKIKSTSFKNLDKSCFIFDDIISKIFVKRRVKKSLTKEFDLLLEIKNWDFIVHIDHWIWIFSWRIYKDLMWVKREYIELLYAKEDKLFVPIDEVHRISKYVWGANPKLNSLSWDIWQKSMKKASLEAKEIANELLEIYSKRKAEKWYSFEIYPSQIEKFQNEFEFNYTHDQKTAIENIFSSMSKTSPMDMLLCWDVWFWKTEIAFNAIFNAITNKKQVALISPLVVLAYEHYEKALERFSKIWVNIAVITRLESASKVKNTLDKLEKWEINLVIWTHKLLWNSVKFKDLWLLVVDEEHKFWVQDKEKIKKLKASLDVLTMSATPIPRSLNMALSWVMDISTLKTPPFWRKAIKTTVCKFWDEVILKAWNREFERWWQIFFIHNNLKTIDWFKSYLETIFPWKKVVITHWRLEWYELEDRIVKFKNKEYDILLSTTVVENWVNFTNVNTIFINDAYKFWLSQIHQLRWRVWRKDLEWYCYLLYSWDKMTVDWQERLKTLALNSHLGSWFDIAAKDLEIRGWWDILWSRQSWHMSTIWMSTYLSLLEKEVAILKEKEGLLESWQSVEVRQKMSTIELNMSAFIPDEYFSSDLDKLNFYREIESISTLEWLSDVIFDFESINNDFWEETKNFFDILKMRFLSWKFWIKNIKKLWINYILDFDEENSLENIKSVLDKDKSTKFVIKTPQRLISSVKEFKNERDFLHYLFSIFMFDKKEKKSLKPKIKLKIKK